MLKNLLFLLIVCFALSGILCAAAKRVQPPPLPMMGRSACSWAGEAQSTKAKLLAALDWLRTTLTQDRPGLADIMQEFAGQKTPTLTCREIFLEMPDDAYADTADDNEVADDISDIAKMREMIKLRSHLHETFGNLNKMMSDPLASILISTVTDFIVELDTIALPCHKLLAKALRLLLLKHVCVSGE